MASINPVPTTRVGDYFVRQRLIGQTQNDQLDLFRLQTQISTGRRLQFASDDAPAALRAINLQRLLDRKGQVQSNVLANNHFLSAAEAQLIDVSATLIKLRGSTIGVSGNLSNEDERQQAIDEIDIALEELVKAGNAKSQGRYLFAGSRSQEQPYDFNGEHVEYFGNEAILRSYVDIERLFDTNLAGTDVFGGISNKLQGGDLNPHLSADTLLSTINGGDGIGRNPAITLSVNNGTSTVSTVVDLSKAVTLGDVARFIEQAAPTGTEIVATVSGTGLSLQVTNPASGTIAVSEVAQGRTASELGILTPTGATPSGTITGAALNPAVLNTTQLDALLGTKAHARLLSPAAENNDIVLTANQNGAEFNDTHVVFVHDNSVSAGNPPFATYSANTLTVHVLSGQTTATDVVAAINAEGTFTAVADYRDASAPTQAGNGPVQATDFGLVTSGGSGDVLDISSGLVITNGGKTSTLDTSNLHTVEDLLNLINGADLGLVAEINSAHNGINVRSRLNGADLTIGENGGTLATQLGIRSYTATAKLADFNRGLGVPTQEEATDNDVLITARDGTQLTLNLSTATTVQDVIELINNNPANNTGTTRVVAQLASTGNGIQLVDQSTVTIGDLIVQTVEGSQAAEYLGFVAKGDIQTSSNTTDSAGNYVLQSADRNTIESDSVFNTLARLKQALQDNNTEEIGRTINRLDVDLDRVNFARSEIGSRVQSLEVIATKLEDENVQLRSALSDDMDVDLVEAISNMTARQFALQASLQTSASILQLSLLNFI